MKYLLLIATAVIAMLFLFWRDVEDLLPAQKFGGNNQGKSKQHSSAAGIEVLQHWALPNPLKEVSGIAYLDDDRFAAIQDEAGTIFIFNKKSQKIEKEIRFGASGDYEGLAVKESTAFVVTGGGTIFEVDMGSTPVAVKEHYTSLTGDNNVEGLCFDPDNNRLLLAVKDRDLNSTAYKGIYAFDLATNQFSETPVFKILKDDPAFKVGKKNKEMMPSAIGIHPTTKNIYITDGPNARLLIMNRSGQIHQLLDLGKKFAQPEGITFSPAGSVYISNEGNKEPGNIIEVSVND